MYSTLSKRKEEKEPNEERHLVEPQPSSAPMVPIGTNVLEQTYEKLFKIGQGAFGEVWKGVHRVSHQFVAMKKIKTERETEGFPITALREISILQKLRRTLNVVELLEICYSELDCSYWMVLEFMDHDLTGLLYNSEHTAPFSEAQIKCYFQQLIRGLACIHNCNILHRDIKASNLLISNDGMLKITDFGLARENPNSAGQSLLPSLFSQTSRESKMTNRVVTIWYRSPELLLGSTMYGPSVDMWSAGCILAEMVLRNPLFQGKDEMEQLSLIFDLCGTPDTNGWSCEFIVPSETKPRRLQDKFKDRRLDPVALNLLDGLLCMDPKKRLTAEQALRHPYFSTGVPPALPSSLPKYNPSNDLLIRQQHEEKVRKYEQLMEIYKQQQQQQQQLQQQLQQQQLFQNFFWQPDVQHAALASRGLVIPSAAPQSRPGQVWRYRQQHRSHPYAAPQHSRFNGSSKR